MLWRWTKGGIVIPVEVLGIWPAIARIGEEGGQWKEEGWNMEEEGSRRFMIKEKI